MENKQIRLYKQADWKSFRPLIMEQWEPENVYAYNAVKYEYLDPYYYQSVFFKRPYKVFVYIVDKKVAAYLVVKLNTDDREIEIIYLYTGMEYRRKGLGEALMRFLEQFGKAFKYKHIWCYSVIDNTRTNTMKEKLGYKFEMRSYVAIKKL